jgi:signal transduction histidine kinase
MPTPVSNADVLARLAAHTMLGSAPAEEHEWLAKHGTVMRAELGEVVVPKGGVVPSIFIVLRGRVVLRTDRGAGSHKIYEMGAGGVGGQLPYSRMTVAPADGVVEEGVEYLDIHKDHIAELTRACPVTTARMVHAMLDRARQFKISDLHDEKLISLGKLAAGLAHELGNPASAAVRSAKLLAKRLDEAERAATALGEAGLSIDQWAAIRGAVSDCAATSEFATTSALARSDRIDELEGWLDSHGVDDSCAEPLAETGITIGALDTLATRVQGEALQAAIRWIAAGCGLRTLAYEVDMATSRIQQLVKSVKGFTFMDHAPATEPVDIREGIHDTFTMLAAKRKAKAAEITISLPDDLPRAMAVGAELNQVWMNLIDNALDVIGNAGHVTVSARAEREKLIVTIADDGPGIPVEIQGRIFDPFFTTKDVGKGTGLGLDIVRRIVQRLEGEIELESRPGRTEFRVTLPLAR